MITINDKEFYEKPGSCGACPFFNCGATSRSAGSEEGHCLLFDEMHHRWRNPPNRCRKIFNAAMKEPDGSALVIVKK